MDDQIVLIRFPLSTTGESRRHRKEGAVSSHPCQIRTPLPLRQGHNEKDSLSLGTVFFLLAAAYSLGEVNYFLKGIVQRTFNLTPFAGIAVGNILFSCVLLLAISSIKRQVSTSKVIACVYVVFGLVASFSMFFYFMLPFHPSSIARSNALSPESHIAMTGALMVALGLSAFLPARRQA
ncbi:hypothetical protein ACRS5L_11595 [Metapseudomonas otitidis]|uniref:hypothetical protein n=1 Tax=Metapseudomonas otitidis TaxID=319939 RepID=UPI003EE195E0